jgi:hypothetical protein
MAVLRRDVLNYFKNTMKKVTYQNVLQGGAEILGVTYEKDTFCNNTCLH